MKCRSKTKTLAAAGLVAGVAVVGTAATTFAWFSATGKGADSQAAAATVALGRGGGSVALAYKDLKPGDPKVTQLVISYQGSVPADIALEIAPSGSPSLCVQHNGQWKSRPGGAVTLAIASHPPVSYCELLNGRILPLASAMRPGSEQRIDVAVTLSADANDNLRGLVEKDVATVRASGGFTDHAVGTISISTSSREKDSKAAEGGQREDGKRTPPDAVGTLDTTIAAAAGTSPQSPAPGTPSGHASVQLPAECSQAGMRLDSFEDVIVLGPDQHIWKAPEQRGQGAGPFLIVGTDGDDEIVGSGGANCIVGGGGNDKLAGGAGNDVLIGGPGADQLDGGPGDDWLVGGAGVDALHGGGGIDRFDGGPDGASCDAGHDAASVVHCHAPASSTVTSGEKDRTSGQMTIPTTANPPPPANPAPPSASATTTAAPASANSAPPATPPAQAGSPATPAQPSGDGTPNASPPNGASGPPVAAPTTSSAPPISSSSA